MATQLLEIPVVETIDFIENGENQIRLPRQNHIRRINLDFNIDVTTAVSAGGVLKPYTYLNVIKRVKLEAGTTTLFSWNAVNKYIMDWIELGVKPLRDADGRGPSNFKIRLSHDFALRRKALRSLSEVLNPAQFADLKLSVEWGDRGDIKDGEGDAVIDKDDTQCNVSLVTAYNDSKEGANLIPDSPPLIREVQRNRVDISRAYADLDGDSLETDIVPTGNTILRRFLFAEKNVTAAGTSPLYADDVIRNLQYQDIRGGRELYVRDSWMRMIAQNKTDFSLRDRPAGVLCEDWLDFRAGGLFVPSSEALKAYFTTNAPAGGQTNALTVLERFI